MNPYQTFLTRFFDQDRKNLGDIDALYDALKDIQKRKDEESKKTERKAISGSAN